MRRVAPLILIVSLFLATAARAEFSLLALKNSLVQFALSQISVEGEFEITAEDVIEPEDGTTELTGIEIADGEGVWLRAEAFAIRWDASRILSGELEIQELTARGLEVLRSPTPPDVEIKPGSELDRAPAQGLFDWPRSPLTLRIEAMRLERAFIAAGVLAEQSLSFEATGAARDEGDVQALSLTLRRTDETSGDITLDYARNFESNTLRLDLDASEAAGGLVAELLGLPAESALRVVINADGPLTDWRLALDAEAQEVLEASATAAIHAEAPVSITAEAALRPGPRLDADARAALGEQANLSLSVEENDEGQVIIRQARLAAPAIDAEISGLFDRAGNSLDGRLRAEAGPALARLLGVSFSRIGFSGTLSGPLSSLGADGALTVSDLTTEALDLRSGDLDLKVAPEGERYRFGLDGAAAGLRLDQLTPEILGEASLTLQGATDGATLDLETADIRSTALIAHAEGAVAIDGQTLDLSYSAQAPDLAPVAAAYGVDASGALRAQGRVSGPFAAPRVEGEAMIDDLVAAGRSLGDPTLSHDVTLGASMNGSARLESASPDMGPIRAALEFESRGAAILARRLEAEVAGVTANGAGLVIEDGLIDGRVALRAPDLGSLSPLAGAAMRGGANGEIRLTPREARQQAEANLAITDLAVAGISIARTKLSTTVADAFGDPELSLRGQISSLETGGARLAAASLTAEFSTARNALTARLDGDTAVAGPVTLETLALAVRGPLERLNLQVDAAGATAGTKPLALSAGASLDLSENDAAATIQRARLGLGNEAFSLRRPMTITQRQDGLTVSPIDLTGAGASLIGKARIADDGLVAQASLTAADVSKLADVLDAPAARGALDAQLSLDTRPAHADGQLSLTLTGFSASDIVDAESALDASIRGAWNGRTARIDARLTGPFGAPLTSYVEVALPAGGLVPTPAPDAALSGAIDWRGRIEEIWGFLPFPDHELSGDLDIAMTLDGALSDPAPAGTISLTDGAYQFLETGTVLTELSLNSNRAPDGAMMLEGRASDAGGAPVTFRARIAGSSLDAELSAVDAVLVRRDDATAALTLDIAARGPLAAPRISGEIRVNRAELRLLDASAPTIADLGPVDVVGAAPAKAPADRPDASGDAGPTLDISVTAPDSIFVRGRGLTSEWRASLAVTGQAASPRITGSVEQLRGELDFLGRRFDLARGKVEFFGAPSPDPTLDIALERQADDLLGRIVIGGTARAPELGFQSEPALPEDEILPRLIFDKSRQSLSASQALELASGLATLLSGREGMLGRVRSATGLDVLSIDQGDDGAAVRAGRRVADGVFVGVRQPVDGSGSSVEVEAEVFDGVTIDSAIEPQGGSSFGLNFRYDF